MKKISFLIFVFFIFSNISLAQTADIDTSGDSSCAVISTNLRYGSRDTSSSGAVSILQDFLYSHGYLSVQPSGFFGSMTRSAVISFQNANGISATPPGFVGSLTRAKIQSIDCINSPATTSVINQNQPVTLPTSNPAYIAPTNSVQSPQITQAPIITSVQSAGNPTGTINVNQKASIHGLGLNGQIIIKIGVQDVQTITITNTSDTYAEFIVPTKTGSSVSSISITNSAGLTSNSYQVNINVPQTVPNIMFIQSAGNPLGTVSVNQKAYIYGTGLTGQISVKIGNYDSQTVIAKSISDTYVEFLVPSGLKNSIVDIAVINSSGLVSNSYRVNIDAPSTTQAAVITSIQSAGNSVGVVDANRKASIIGKGLNGPLTIKIGNQDSQAISVTGVSDTYAEFTVPTRSVSSIVDIAVINSSGLVSNLYQTNINVSN